jgi:RHS repeat-associated protein
MHYALRRSLILLFISTLAVTCCLGLAGAADEDNAGRFASPSARGKETKVPSVVGYSAKEAKAAIQAAGLVSKFQLGAAADSPEKALTVYLQRPQPGAAVVHGEPVYLTLYAEHRGRLTPGLAAADQVRLTQVVAIPLLNQAEETIDPRAGRLLVAVTDLSQRAGAVTLDVRRTLQLSSSPPGLLGNQWRLNWESRLTKVGSEAEIQEDAQAVHFSPDKATPRLRSPGGDELTIDADRAVRIRPNGTRETFDEQGRLIEKDERNGNKITLVYDDQGRLARIDGPCDTSLLFSTNEQGRLTKVESSTGATVVYSYDGQQADTGQGETVQPDAARPVGYAYDAAGMLTSIEHPQFGETSFAYDAQGRVSKRSWADGTSEQYYHDDATRTLRHTDPTGQVTLHTWSQDGRSSKVTTPLGRTIATAYDESGRVTAMTGPTGQTARLTYDPLGRTVAIDDPRSGTTRFEYLGNTRLPIAIISPAKRQTLEYDSQGNPVRLVDDVDPAQNCRFAYLPNGQVSSIILGDGQQTRYTYNAAGQRETVSDAAGNTWRYEYDERGNQVREIDPLKAVTSRTYDAHNRPTSVTDPSGAVTRYAYEQRDRFNVVAETDARGGTTRATHDQRGRLIAVSDAAQRTTKYNYDENGRLTSATDPAGQTYRYEYDAIGSLVAEINPLGGFTKRTYDALGKPTSVVAPQGTVDRYQYSSMGLLVKTEGSSGQRSTYDYDGEGRLIAETDAADRVTQYDYTAAGRLAKTIPPSGPVIAYAYDNFGRLARIERGKQVIVNYQYDALGQRIKEKQAGGLEISYRYDAVGNLIGWQDNHGGRGTTKYDLLGRVIASTDASGSTAMYTYDAAGQLLDETDPLGQVKHREYDLAGQLIEVAEPNGDLAKYEYDAAGRLDTAWHPGGGKTSYAYDALGNVVKAIDPLGRETQSTYDSSGRVASVTDAKGQTTNFTFDRDGRLQEKQLAGGKRIRYEYDALGRLVKVDDGEFPILYTCDDDGNVLRIEYPAIKRKLSFEYNEAGLKTRFTDSESGAVVYRYDHLDRVTSIETAGKSSIVLSYDVKDRLTTVVWPNQVEGAWEYDAEDRPLKLTFTDAAGSIIVGWTYKYDAAGNLVETTTADGRVTRYRYDAAGQLLEESTDGQQSVQYDYAAGGNRIKLRGTGHSVEYRYDEADQLVAAGDETFQYDANGNLIERRGPEGATRYSYDVEDRLVKVELPQGEEITYGYGPTGERVWRRDANGLTWFVTDGTNLCAELGEDLKARATYVHAQDVDSPLLMLREGRRYFYHADRLRSVSLLTDESGRVMQSYRYAAFGQPQSEPQTPANPFTFTGRELDRATGLYYFRARWYDASTGRFLSRDPAPPQTEDARSFNPYLYVLNSPLGYVDPWGTNARPPLPPGVDPTTRLSHFTTSDFRDAVRSAAGAAGAYQGVGAPAAAAITPRGGQLHATTLKPGQGAAHPSGIGTPRASSASISATADEWARAGNVVELNPHPPGGAPPRTAYLIKPPPGQDVLIIPKNTEAGGGFYPARAARNRGGFIGTGGRSLSVPPGVSIPGGTPTPWRDVGRAGMLWVGVGFSAAHIINAEDKTQAVIEVAVSHSGAVVGGVIGGGLLGPPGAVAGSFVGGLIGNALVNPNEPGSPSPYKPSETASQPLSSAPASGTTAGTPVLVQDTTEPPSVTIAPLSDLPTGPGGGSINIPGGTPMEPTTFLGPAPEPDPNAHWPICPKCGQRHDPNE